MSGGAGGNRQDNRQRGNAAQLLEKYKSLARDAQLAGDRVQTEYYLQYRGPLFPRARGEPLALRGAAGPAPPAPRRGRVIEVRGRRGAGRRRPNRARTKARSRLASAGPGRERGRDRDRGRDRFERPERRDAAPTARAARRGRSQRRGRRAHRARQSCRPRSAPAEPRQQGRRRPSRAAGLASRASRKATTRSRRPPERREIRKNEGGGSDPAALSIGRRSHEIVTCTVTNAS